MKKATVKNIIVALVVLAIVTMTACNLATPADTGNSVEVVLDGTEGARGSPGITGDGTVQWIRIRVMDSTGVQVGMGTMERVDGILAFKKKLTGLPAGTLDFMVWAGKTEASADTVLYFGGASEDGEMNAWIQLIVTTGNTINREG